MSQLTRRTVVQQVHKVYVSFNVGRLQKKGLYSLQQKAMEPCIVKAQEHPTFPGYKDGWRMPHLKQAHTKEVALVSEVDIKPMRVVHAAVMKIVYARNNSTPAL